MTRKDWTQETCKDCGAFLDAFGVCPSANPKRAALETAPVRCGKTPQEVTREINSFLRRVA